MTEACSECGSTTWIASVVVDGVRTCAACLIGLTQVRGRAPVVATVADLAPRNKAAKR